MVEKGLLDDENKSSVFEKFSNDASKKLQAALLQVGDDDGFRTALFGVGINFFSFSGLAGVIIFFSSSDLGDEELSEDEEDALLECCFFRLAAAELGSSFFAWI